MQIRRLIVAAAFAPLALVSCGGSDAGESEAADSAAPPPVESAPAPTEAEADAGTADSEAAEVTVPATDPPEETSAPVDTDFSGDGSGEFCSKLEELVNAPDLFGDDLEQTPEQTQEEFTAILDSFDDLEGSAPDEIAGDVGALGEVFKVLDGFYQRFDYDLDAMQEQMIADPALQEEFVNLTSGIDDTAIDAATTRLEAYQTDVCGIPLES